MIKNNKELFNTVSYRGSYENVSELQNISDLKQYDFVYVITDNYPILYLYMNDAWYNYNEVKQYEISTLKAISQNQNILTLNSVISDEFEIFDIIKINDEVKIIIDINMNSLILNEEISSEISSETDLFFCKKIIFNENFMFNENVIIKENLFVKENTILGKSNMSTTTIRGNVDVSDIEKQTNINGYLNVKQKQIFENDIYINQKINVEGESTFNNDMTINKNLVLNDDIKVNDEFNEIVFETEKSFVVKTGLVSGQINTNIINGVNTKFEEEFKIGDRIQIFINNDFTIIQKVTSIQNNNQLNINSSLPTTFSDKEIKLYQKKLNLNGDLNIFGNFNNVDVDNLNITDRIIKLNNNEIGDGISGSSDEEKQSGFQIDRGTKPDVFLLWNEINEKFEFKDRDNNLLDVGLNDVTLNSQNIKIQNIEQKIVINDNITMTQNDVDILDIDKSFRVNDNIYLQNDLNIKNVNNDYYLNIKNNDDSQTKNNILNIKTNNKNLNMDFDTDKLILTESKISLNENNNELNLNGISTISSQDESLQISNTNNKIETIGKVKIKYDSDKNRHELLKDDNSKSNLNLNNAILSNNENELTIKNIGNSSNNFSINNSKDSELNINLDKLSIISNSDDSTINMNGDFDIITKDNNKKISIISDSDSNKTITLNDDLSVNTIDNIIFKQDSVNGYLKINKQDDSSHKVELDEIKIPNVSSLKIDNSDLKKIMMINSIIFG